MSSNCSSSHRRTTNQRTRKAQTQPVAPSAATATESATIAPLTEEDTSTSPPCSSASSPTSTLPVNSSDEHRTSGYISAKEGEAYSNAYMVEVLLSSQKWVSRRKAMPARIPAVMAIDTMSSVTSITQAQFDQMNPPPRQICGARALSGCTRPAYLVFITVGSHTLDVEVDIEDEGHNGATSIGVLGRDVLNFFHQEYDPPQNRVTLTWPSRRSDARGSSTTYTLGKGADNLPK